MRQKLMGEVFKNRRVTHGILGQERYWWYEKAEKIFGYVITAVPYGGFLRNET